MRISLASPLKHQTPEMNTIGTTHTYYRLERCFRICDVEEFQGHTGTQQCTNLLRFKTCLTLILTARVAETGMPKSGQASGAGTYVYADTYCCLIALQCSNKGSRMKLTILATGRDKE